MNQLSWILYAANVCDNAAWLLSILTILGTIGAILWAVIGLIEDSLRSEQWCNWRRCGLYVILPCWLLGVIPGIFVPSKETVYAIAASEIGEQALHTSVGNKAFKALDSWLDKQITPPAKP